jgi:hypothetical protein
MIRQLLLTLLVVPSFLRAQIAPGIKTTIDAGTMLEITAFCSLYTKGPTAGYEADETRGEEAGCLAYSGQGADSFFINRSSSVAKGIIRVLLRADSSLKHPLPRIYRGIDPVYTGKQLALPLRQLPASNGTLWQFDAVDPGDYAVRGEADGGYSQGLGIRLRGGDVYVIVIVMKSSRPGS